MKKIIFILIVFLFACCNTIHKVRRTDFIDSRKMERTKKDSVAIKLMDSLGINRKNSLWQLQNELTYERVIEEEIVALSSDSSMLPDLLRLPPTEHQTHSIAKVQIRRRITERGVNTSIGKGQTNSEDSAHRNASAQWNSTEQKEQDSVGSTRKTVNTKKKTGLQWYVWIIAGILVGVVIWWKGKEKFMRFFS